MVLDAFGLSVAWSEPTSADVCVIGSILDIIPKTFSGAIVGAGFIQAGPQKTFDNATFLAIRGPLSAERAGIEKTTFGDAGLLAPKLVAPPSNTKYSLGIVPHYFDKTVPAIQKIIDRKDSRILIIDVQAGADEVLAQIASCEAILSSSLHGIVVADSYDRRSGWLELSDSVIGQGFKFRDYARSLGHEAEPLKISGDETLDQLVSMTSFKEFDRVGKIEELSAEFLVLKNGI